MEQSCWSRFYSINLHFFKELFLSTKHIFFQQLPFKIPLLWRCYFPQCYLDTRATQHSIRCVVGEIELLTHTVQSSSKYYVSLHFFFLNIDILSQEKIKSSGGKISGRKGWSFASRLRRTQRMWGSFTVKWLSVLQCSAVTWHNKVRSVYDELHIVKVSKSKANCPLFRYNFIHFNLKGLKVK